MSAAPFLAPALKEDEEAVEQTLRPRSLDDFVGQERVKEQLEIALAAAKARGEALDHVLLVGPPGLGKTSLANIIREELGVGIRSVAGPSLETAGHRGDPQLGRGARRDLRRRDPPDEPRRGRDPLSGARGLPTRRRDGAGSVSHTLTLTLAPFTLVGATTRTGLLTSPLRDRFGMTFRLDYYDPGQLAQIVKRSARILGVEIADDAAEEIAGRSRGTPRIANRILRRVRDVAQVRHEGSITTAIAREALELLEVDEAGLERMDRGLLRTIVEKFDGGPVGLTTLAASLGEEPDTIEDVYEPFMLQLGFIQRTPRGRTITKLGRAHIGAAPAETKLF